MRGGLPGTRDRCVEASLPSRSRARAVPMPDATCHPRTLGGEEMPAFASRGRARDPVGSWPTLSSLPAASQASRAGGPSATAVSSPTTWQLLFLHFCFTFWFHFCFFISSFEKIEPAGAPAAGSAPRVPAAPGPGWASPGPRVGSRRLQLGQPGCPAGLSEQGRSWEAGGRPRKVTHVVRGDAHSYLTL